MPRSSEAGSVAAVPMAAAPGGPELAIVFATGLYEPKGRDSVSIQTRDYLVGLHDVGASVHVLDMTAQGELSPLLRVGRTAAMLTNAYGYPRPGAAIARPLVRRAGWRAPGVRLARRLNGRAERPIQRPGAGKERDKAVVEAITVPPGAAGVSAARSVVCVVNGYDLMFAPGWGGVWREGVHACLQRAFPAATRIRWVANVVNETTCVASTIVTGLRAFDEVWVPARFQAEALGRSGLSGVPVHTVPEAADLEVFHPGVAPATIPGRREFCFLTVSQYLPDQRPRTDERQGARDLALLWNQGRKATDLLVRAFVEEFGPDEDVCLAVKSTHETGEVRDALLRVLAQIGSPAERLAQVIPLGGWTDTRGLAALYAAADAFVLVSRGEGWGRPLAEAMAMGKPAVATGFGGNTDFMDARTAYLVDYEVVPVASTLGRKFAGLGEWAEPSLADLRRTLRAIVTDREAARGCGRRGADFVRRRLGRADVARAIEARARASVGLSVDARR